MKKLVLSLALVAGIAALSAAVPAHRPTVAAAPAPRPTEGIPQDILDNLNVIRTKIDVLIMEARVQIAELRRREMRSEVRKGLSAEVKNFATSELHGRLRNSEEF